MERILTQEGVRKRLLELIDNGVMAKYIAKQTSVAESSLSKFRHNKLELSIPELRVLSEFLGSKGF